MAEIVLVEQGPNFLKVSWKEPDGTGLTHYHLWIHPNDAGLQLPITVNKYVHSRPYTVLQQQSNTLLLPVPVKTWTDSVSTYIF